ncbi:MAG: DnaA/Hda family protein, partial [Firmicutes bacterium]|nr:DnaA/Hda family protein [Bacillota bacterium]
RKEEEANAKIFYESLLQKHPNLYKVEAAFRALFLDEIKGKKIDKKEKAALEGEKRTILAQLKIDDKRLYPPPRCTKCKDTAFVSKEYCECVRVLALDEKPNIEIPCTSFFKIDYKKFDPKHLKRNQAIYQDVEKIIEKYPSNKKKIVLVMGSTGTGKTLLAGCAVNAMRAKNRTACAVTAFGFVQRTLNYHTTFDTEKQSFIAPLLNSDLLIIDDLGTESILKNVTHEYLLTILNERTNQNKLTLFTTNLSKEGIIERYGERISSRLFDKDISYQNILSGKDLRQ